MEPSTIASIAASVGKVLLAAVVRAGVDAAKTQLQPDRMEQVLKIAFEQAQPKADGKFFRSQSQNTQEFFEKFFRAGEVLTEFQKPLLDRGKPDIAILIAVFERAVKEHPEDFYQYDSDELHRWMEAFVESYFQQIKGICFQVAKKQYQIGRAHV